MKKAKRIIVAVLAFLMVFAGVAAMASCGGSPTPDPQTSSQASQSREEQTSEGTDESSGDSGRETSSIAELSSVEEIVKDRTFAKEIKFLTREVFSSGRRVQTVSDEFRKGYADSALKLLKTASGGKSALISPLSILTALQMTANGAKGATKEEMQAVLCGMETEALNQQLYNYYESLKNTKDSSMNVSNAIWLTSRTDFHVNDDFIDLMNDTFRAQVATAPLYEKTTVDAINGWCKKNTDGMIEKILNYDDVDMETTMILLNALCFEALWAEQYQDHQCRQADFHGEKGTTKVTMMYSEETGYISGAYETGFVKRYSGGGYAFVGLLPKQGMSMSDYLATLTGERFLSLLDDRKGAVDAGLPKFKFDWTDSLVGTLQTLGMKKAFTAGSDLSGLGYYDDGMPLYISNVIHKTHIEVEESGTKAAAVTAVIVNKATAVAPGYVKTVILDRPFVYAIVDTETNLPVFIGCITDIG